MNCSRFLLLSVAVVFCSAVGSESAEAQDDLQPGFFFGLGVGPGRLLGDDTQDLGRTGGAWYLRLGGSPSANFRLSGEAMIWGAVSQSVTRGRGNVMAVGQFYPMRGRGGLYLKAGLGLAAAIAETELLGYETSTGFGTDVGLGYDFRAGGTLLLSVGIDWMGQFMGEVLPINSSNSMLIATIGISSM